MHLILNTFGITLGKEQEHFVVSTPEGKQNIIPDQVETITIAKGSLLTSDAILLAIAHKIDILFVNNMGNPEGRIWSVQYGSISDIRRKQLDYMYSPKVIPWVKNLLCEKINNQVAILLAHHPTEMPGSNIFKYAINSLDDYMQKIQSTQAEQLSDIAASLRGWEGAASKKYFATINTLLPTQFQFATRTRQPATDIFNAILNYGYGMLYNKIEGALIKAGIDPYAGIFHRDDYNRPALVFDIIEKYRHWIDYVMINLCTQNVLDDECYVIDEDTNAIQLQALGKRIVIQAVNDYLSEIVPYGNMERSRQTIIDLDAHKLANTFTEI
jgi:CRISP-associated protein Cas1